MPRINEMELARLAGTHPERVNQMVEHGLLPAEGETALRTEDVRRVQLIEAFEQSGIPMSAMRAVIDAGHFSLAFTTVQWQNNWVGEFSGETYGASCARARNGSTSSSGCTWRWDSRDRSLRSDGREFGAKLVRLAHGRWGAREGSLPQFLLNGRFGDREERPRRNRCGLAAGGITR